MVLALDGIAMQAEFEQVFTAKSLNSFIEVYFLHFDPYYPTIHRPTFGMRDPSPYLLLAIVFLGTAWAEDKKAFEISSRLHGHVRQKIFSVGPCILQKSAFLSQ